MIIKKFQAKTEQEAVEQAKRELGEGLVIMNVRSIKKKGLFGIFKKSLTEVTVALEEERETKAVSRNKPQAAQEPQEPIPYEKQEPVKEMVASSSSAIEEKLDNLHSLLEQQLQKAEEEEKEEENKPLERTKEEEELQHFKKLLYNTMLENEVEESYANEIIDEMEKNQKPGMPFDYALAGIYQKMILKFGNIKQITPAKKGAKTIFFIGPTGVGKTTTIAKLASKLCLEEQKKVVLLTADTYRIAAAEQLRTYAGILEVPFRIIYSEAEMKQAVLDFADSDFILVDTAGRSHRNEEQKESMKKLLSAVEEGQEKEVYLVLSATTKESDLLGIVDAYKDLTEYSLIFTKLDETDALGNLLNIRLHTGASLSYITDGQNVPDDIESFNPQKTVKLLLGGRKN